MDELQETIETLIDLDEPEAILPSLRRAAERRKGVRWQRLAAVLGEAEVRLDQLANAKPAGPDFRPDAEATHKEQQELMRQRASLHPDLEKPDALPDAAKSE
jgi:hypothetical protein